MPDWPPQAGTVWQSGSVHPPRDTSGTLVQPKDAFDVPVRVRRSSPLRAEGPGQAGLDRADQPWPGPGKTPVEGLYRVSTTWRDVLDAALSVGRDPTRWVGKAPELAWAEIIARISPLVAYLGRQRHTGGTGYRVAPSVVYNNGPEASARGGFSYQMGMAMAEWACRGLMGSGPTTHAETKRPVNAGSAWSSPGLPDLVAHPAGPTTWLIEAKGRLNLKLPDIRKGICQLSTPGLLTGDQVRVLCCTGLNPYLLMTIDIDERIGRQQLQPHQAKSDRFGDNARLLALTRSRMLLYYALEAMTPTDRWVVQVDPAAADAASYRSGTVMPLEWNHPTHPDPIAARDRGTYDRLDGQERLDMLAGRVPDTDLIIGMSRPLFNACRHLHAFRWSGTWTGHLQDPYEAFLNDDVSILPGRLDTADVVQLGFERGAQSSWHDLLGRQTSSPQSNVPDGFLEAATADTYLAVKIPPAMSSLED